MCWGVAAVCLQMYSVGSLLLLCALFAFAVCCVVCVGGAYTISFVLSGAR